MTVHKRAEELAGTAYVEFEAVGEETSESIHIDLDDFDVIEPIVRRHLRSFGYAGQNAPTKGEWEALATELKEYPENLTAGELAEWLSRRIAEDATIYMNGL